MQEPLGSSEACAAWMDCCGLPVSRPVCASGRRAACQGLASRGGRPLGTGHWALGTGHGPCRVLLLPGCSMQGGGVACKGTGPACGSSARSWQLAAQGADCGEDLRLQLHGTPACRRRVTWLLASITLAQGRQYCWMGVGNACARA